MNNILTGFAIQTACSNCERSDRATAIVRPGKSRRELYLCAKCMLSAVSTLNYMDGAQPEVTILLSANLKNTSRISRVPGAYGWMDVPRAHVNRDALRGV